MRYINFFCPSLTLFFLLNNLIILFNIIRFSNIISVELIRRFFFLIVITCIIIEIINMQRNGKMQVKMCQDMSYATVLQKLISITRTYQNLARSNTIALLRLIPRITIYRCNKSNKQRILWNFLENCAILSHAICV